jgi:hypothetical protein
MAATSGLGTVFGENVSLDAILGSGTPATVYVCAYSAAPTKAGGGTEITNLPRKAVTNNATNFPGAAAGAKSNGVEIKAGPATNNCAEAPWWGVHAHATLDQLIAWGPLTTPRTVGNGDYLTFAIGDMDFSFKNDGE